MEEEGLDVVQVTRAHRRPRGVLQLSCGSGEVPRGESTVLVWHRQCMHSKQQKSKKQHTQSTVKRLLRNTDMTQENS